MACFRLETGFSIGYFSRALLIQMFSNDFTKVKLKGKLVKAFKSKFRVM